MFEPKWFLENDELIMVKCCKYTCNIVSTTTIVDYCKNTWAGVYKSIETISKKEIWELKFFWNYKMDELKHSKYLLKVHKCLAMFDDFTNYRKIHFNSKTCILILST